MNYAQKKASELKYAQEKASELKKFIDNHQSIRCADLLNEVSKKNGLPDVLRFFEDITGKGVLQYTLSQEEALHRQSDHLQVALEDNAASKQNAECAVENAQNRFNAHNNLNVTQNNNDLNQIKNAVQSKIDELKGRMPPNVAPHQPHEEGRGEEVNKREGGEPAVVDGNEEGVEQIEDENRPNYDTALQEQINALEQLQNKILQAYLPGAEETSIDVDKEVAELGIETKYIEENERIKSLLTNRQSTLTLLHTQGQHIQQEQGETHNNRMNNINVFHVLLQETAISRVLATEKDKKGDIILLSAIEADMLRDNNEQGSYLKVLMESSDVSIEDRYGPDKKTAFHKVCEDSHPQAVRILDILKTTTKADKPLTTDVQQKRMLRGFTTIDAQGNTPLHYAAQSNASAIIDYSLDPNHGLASKLSQELIYSNNGEGLSPIMIAIRHNKSQALDAMMENADVVNAIRGDEKLKAEIINEAIISGNQDTLNMLSHVVVEKYDNLIQSFHEKFVSDGTFTDKSVLKRLVENSTYEKNDPLLSISQFMNSPAFEEECAKIADEVGNIAVFKKYCEKHGENINESVKVAALKHGHPKIVEHLANIEGGLRMGENDAQENVFHIAAQSSKEEQKRVLDDVLDQNALKDRNSDGKTPITVAIENNNAEFVNTIIDSIDDVNSKNDITKEALATAASTGSLESLEELVNKDPKRIYTKVEGDNLLEKVAGGNVQVREKLLLLINTHKREQEKEHSHENEEFMKVAAKNAAMNILPNKQPESWHEQFILDSGLTQNDIKAKLDDGINPMTRALLNGNASAAKALNKIDPTLKTQKIGNENSPLNLAKMMNDPNAIKALGGESGYLAEFANSPRKQVNSDSPETSKAKDDSQLSPDVLSQHHGELERYAHAIRNGKDLKDLLSDVKDKKVLFNTKSPVDGHTLLTLVAAFGTVGQWKSVVRAWGSVESEERSVDKAYNDATSPAGTPLQCALKANNKFVVDEITKSDRSLDILDKAVGFGNLDFVRDKLQAYSSVEGKCERILKIDWVSGGCNLLQKAAQNGDVAMLGELQSHLKELDFSKPMIERKFALLLNGCDNQKRNILHHAIDGKNLENIKETCEILKNLQKFFSKNALRQLFWEMGKDNTERTPTERAIDEDKFSAVEVVAADLPEEQKKPLFERAAVKQKCTLGAISSLLVHGGINQELLNGVAATGNDKVLADLLARAEGSGVNYDVEKINDPLHVAARLGDPAILEKALEGNATEVYSLNEEDYMPIEIAYRNNASPVVISRLADCMHQSAPKDFNATQLLHVYEALEKHGLTKQYTDLMVKLVKVHCNRKSPDKRVLSSIMNNEIKAGNLALVNATLEGSNIEPTPRNLSDAIDQGNNTIVEKLLNECEGNLNINMQEIAERGNRKLFDLISNGKKEVYCNGDTSDKYEWLMSFAKGGFHEKAQEVWETLGDKEKGEFLKASSFIAESNQYKFLNAIATGGNATGDMMEFYNKIVQECEVQNTYQKKLENGISQKETHSIWAEKALLSGNEKLAKHFDDDFQIQYTEHCKKKKHDLKQGGIQKANLAASDALAKDLADKSVKREEVDYKALVKASEGKRGAEHKHEIGDHIINLKDENIQAAQAELLTAISSSDIEQAKNICHKNPELLDSYNYNSKGAFTDLLFDSFQNKKASFPNVSADMLLSLVPYSHPDVTDHSGNTPLLRLLNIRNELPTEALQETIKILIEKNPGALLVKSQDGKSAVDIIVADKRFNVVFTSGVADKFQAANGKGETLIDEYAKFKTNPQTSLRLMNALKESDNPLPSFSQILTRCLDDDIIQDPKDINKYFEKVKGLLETDTRKEFDCTRNVDHDENNLLHIIFDKANSSKSPDKASNLLTRIIDLLDDRNQDVKKLVSAKNKNNESPLDLLARNPYCLQTFKNIEKKLTHNTLKEVADLNKLLRESAKYGNTKLCKYLLDSNGYMHLDINAVDLDGESALLKAMQHGQFEMCHFLIERGADIDQTNKEGKTVLDCALDMIHAGEVSEQQMPYLLMFAGQTLISHGADLQNTTTDKDGNEITTMDRLLRLDKYSKDLSSKLDEFQGLHSKSIFSDNGVEWEKLKFKSRKGLSKEEYQRLNALQDQLRVRRLELLQVENADDLSPDEKEEFQLWQAQDYIRLSQEVLPLALNTHSQLVENEIKLVKSLKASVTPEIDIEKGNAFTRRVRGVVHQTKQAFTSYPMRDDFSAHIVGNKAVLKLHSDNVVNIDEVFQGDKLPGNISTLQIKDQEYTCEIQKIGDKRNYLVTEGELKLTVKGINNKPGRLDVIIKADGSIHDTKYANSSYDKLCKDLAGTKNVYIGGVSLVDVISNGYWKKETSQARSPGLNKQKVPSAPSLSLPDRDDGHDNKKSSGRGDDQFPDLPFPDGFYEGGAPDAPKGNDNDDERSSRRSSFDEDRGKDVLDGDFDHEQSPEELQEEPATENIAGLETRHAGQQPTVTVTERKAHTTVPYDSTQSDGMKHPQRQKSSPDGMHDTQDDIEKRSRDDLMSNIKDLMSSFSNLLDLLNNPSVDNESLAKQMKSKIKDLDSQGYSDLANQLQVAFHGYQNNKNADKKEKFLKELTNILGVHLNKESNGVDGWIKELENKGKSQLAQGLRMLRQQGNMQMTNAQTKKHAQLHSGVVGAPAQNTGEANVDATHSNDKKNLHEAAQGVAEALSQLTKETLPQHPAIAAGDEKAKKQQDKLFGKYLFDANNQKSIPGSSKDKDTNAEQQSTESKKVGGLTTAEYREMQKIGNPVKQEATKLARGIQKPGNECTKEVTKDATQDRNNRKPIQVG